MLHRANKHFYNGYKKRPEISTLGRGKSFHFVIMGDSTMDGSSTSKLQFGPAQVLVDTLANKYKVTVHSLATAGAKSSDVVRDQLPVVNALPKVDIIFIYMGANDVIRFVRPSVIAGNYRKILISTQERQIPVIASEIVNYWYFSIFSVWHRLWIYFAVNSANRWTRSLVSGYKNFVLIYVKKLHKRYRGKQYLADGFHPSDITHKAWGQYILAQVSHNPKTKKLFAGIIHKS